MIPLTTEVKTEMVEIQLQTATEMVEVVAQLGGSILQAFKDYISLDGGRAWDVYTGIQSLDGGGV